MVDRLRYDTQAVGLLKSGHYYIWVYSDDMRRELMRSIADMASSSLDFDWEDAVLVSRSVRKEK